MGRDEIRRIPRAERAKQFMPFAALKGFERALAAKEQILVPQIELTEDAAEELDRKLRQITCGRRITVVFYQPGPQPDLGQYVQMTGMVSRMDGYRQSMTVVDTKIPYRQILSLTLEA